MITHKDLFQRLINGEELTNKFNGKVLKLDADGNAILICKNWHNFNPADWVFLNKPEGNLNSETENKD